MDKGTRGVSYRVFRKLEKNETTVIFVDPAEGGDYSAMTAMSKKYLDALGEISKPDWICDCGRPASKDSVFCKECLEDIKKRNFSVRA